VDQVKQQVWIAEGLIDQYGDILRRYMKAWSSQEEAECHVLHGEIERVYLEIWEQLDGAAKLTQSTGRTTDDSQIRARPDLVTWPELDWTPPATLHVDIRGGFFSQLFRRIFGA